MDKREPVKILRRWKPGLSLAELATQARALAGDQTLIGFGYAPAAAVWLQVDAHGQLQTEGGQPVQGLYELRLFDGAREWRWFSEGASTRAACVAEEGTPLPQGWSGPQEDPEAWIEDRSWLLWGTKVDRPTASGWTTLSTPRTGPFFVPIAGIAAEMGVRLSARVYLGRVDEHGNVGVIEERFTTLEQAAHAVNGGQP